MKIMSLSVVNPFPSPLTFFCCRACLQALKASVVDDAVSFCAVLQNRQKGERGGARVVLLEEAGGRVRKKKKTAEIQNSKFKHLVDHQNMAGPF